MIHLEFKLTEAPIPPLSHICQLYPSSSTTQALQVPTPTNMDDDFGISDFLAQHTSNSVLNRDDRVLSYSATPFNSDSQSYASWEGRQLAPPSIDLHSRQSENRNYNPSFGTQSYVGGSIIQASRHPSHYNHHRRQSTHSSASSYPASTGPGQYEYERRPSTQSSGSTLSTDSIGSFGTVDIVRQNYRLEADITGNLVPQQPQQPQQLSYVPEESNYYPGIQIPQKSFRPIYDCPFDFLECMDSFEEYSDWLEHSKTHFEDGEPPQCLICPQCERKFSGIPGYGTWTCWEERMMHLAKEHIERDSYKPRNRLDFQLIRHLRQLGIIEEAIYRHLCTLTEVKTPIPSNIKMGYQRTAEPEHIMSYPSSYNSVHIRTQGPVQHRRIYRTQ
jgi:hypothetical protein